MLKDKIANEILGIIQERNGANFLTYYKQAYNGRIAPQQTLFDPTSSKAVRFVTANGAPVTIKRGSRQDRNLRQMYAMMLVKGADLKLPDVREQMLKDNIEKLSKWGERLEQVLEGSMTDAQAEQVAQAIEQGIPLNSPEFPQITPLALDPEADAELLAYIKKKGEDGPHAIDGLIDLYKYNKAMKAGKPYHSFFNAYIDGKTNGLAANGIQMGSREVAFATGVMRNSTTDLLDDGDLRDQLQDSMVGGQGFLAVNGFEGTWDPELTPSLYAVANVLYSQRDLHKATTMTFGYGKDIKGFKFNIKSTLDDLYQQSREGDGRLADHLDTLYQAGSGDFTLEQDALAEVLLKPYGEAIVKLMSPEAMKARGLMRHAAHFAALLDMPLKVKTYTGYEANYGGTEALGFDAADSTQFTITNEGKSEKSVSLA